jgi:integrase
MGIYKRGETWCVRIWYLEDGKRRKLERAVGPDRKLAELVQKSLEQERALSDASDETWTGLKKVRTAKVAQMLTFGEIFEKYLDQNNPPLKPSTLLTYKDNYRAHLKDAIGATPIGKITKDSVIVLQNELRAKRYGPADKPLSNTRINNVMNLLRTILNRAVEDELIAENPALKVKRLREEDPDIDPLNLNELQLTLKNMDPFYVPIFTVLAWSGMRPNELKALKWEDVDWNRNEIRISKGIVRKLEGTTKTKSSKRIIQMHPEARRVLEQLRNKNLRNLEGLIFTSKKGDMLSHHLDDIWRKALKKAGLRHRPSYQLRHTWASLALAAGEDPMWVSKMLGHSNAAITFKHYARFIQSEQHGRRIASVLSQNLRQQSFSN